MARTFKLPKKINGFRLPKDARKQANKVLKRVNGAELEALVGVVLAAIVTHLVAPKADEKVVAKVKRAVGRHITAH